MTKQHHTGMVLIAGFKVVKGLLLLLVGLGFLRLVHAETATLFSKLLEALHLNAESHILHAVVLQVDALRPESILTLGAVSMLYAGLLLTEGLGLWFERSWAAYLTVISTSLFIPFELYEIVERITAFILDERMRPGDKLPSERELMVRLGVGRSSLRESRLKTLTYGFIPPCGDASTRQSHPRGLKYLENAELDFAVSIEGTDRRWFFILGTRAYLLLSRIV